MSNQRQVIEECERLFNRYADEVVDRFGLCPWAAKARKDGEVAVSVHLEGSPQEWDFTGVARDAKTTIHIAIFPLSSISVSDLAQFAKSIVTRNQTYAAAGFHPMGIAEGRDTVTSLRSTPDPTIQLVKLAALEDLSSGGSVWVDTSARSLAEWPAIQDPSAAVAAKNEETFRIQETQVQEIVADIMADRNRTYRQLESGAPMWTP